MQFKRNERITLLPQKELDLDLASHMSCVAMEQLSKTEKGKTPLRFEKKRTSFTTLGLNSKSIVSMQKLF